MALLMVEISFWHEMFRDAAVLDFAFVVQLNAFRHWTNE